jgi:hypothetical protein
MPSIDSMLCEPRVWHSRKSRSMRFQASGENEPRISHSAPSQSIFRRSTVPGQFRRTYSSKLRVSTWIRGLPAWMATNDAHSLLTGTPSLRRPVFYVAATFRRVTRSFMPFRVTFRVRSPKFRGSGSRATRWARGARAPTQHVKDPTWAPISTTNRRSFHASGALYSPFRNTSTMALAFPASVSRIGPIRVLNCRRRRPRRRAPATASGRP